MRVCCISTPPDGRHCLRLIGLSSRPLFSETFPQSSIFLVTEFPGHSYLVWNSFHLMLVEPVILFLWFGTRPTRMSESLQRFTGNLSLQSI